VVLDISGYNPGSVGFLGIDVYQVYASSFGPNYDLAIYYIFMPTDTYPEFVVVPIALYASKGLGTLFTSWEDLTVSRKGLTITTSNLPHTLPEGYVVVGEIPDSVTVTANPSLSRPTKIPLEFQTIAVRLMIVTFQGTWCVVSDTEYFVFNVRVTIAFVD